MERSDNIRTFWKKMMYVEVLLCIFKDILIWNLYFRYWNSFSSYVIHDYRVDKYFLIRHDITQKTFIRVLGWYSGNFRVKQTWSPRNVEIKYFGPNESFLRLRKYVIKRLWSFAYLEARQCLLKVEKAQP